MAEISTSNLMYDALMAQYNAKRLEALHGLSVYLTNSVGIGEHPQLMDEAAKFAEMLATSEDVLTCLKRNFSTETLLNEVKE